MAGIGMCKPHNVLSKGALVTGSSKAWLGGFGEIAPFGLVSNGKKLVAKAITDKGVSTSDTDTFATMANNIVAIKSLSARQDRILSNVKFSINEVANSATLELISGPDHVYYHTTEKPFRTDASDGSDIYILGMGL